MPCKLWLYLLNITISNEESGKTILSYLLTFWCLLDWGITIFVLMVIYSYLRSWGGNLGDLGINNNKMICEIWAKMAGKTEQVVEIGI